MVRQKGKRGPEHLKTGVVRNHLIRIKFPPMLKGIKKIRLALEPLMEKYPFLLEFFYVYNSFLLKILPMLKMIILGTKCGLWKIT